MNSTRAGVVRGLSGALAGSALLLVGPVSPAHAGTAGATTTVNIRSGPSTDAEIVGRLVRGQRISTIGRPRDGWVSVRFRGGRASIAAQYLDLDAATLPPPPRRIDPDGVKVATENLNVRTGPSTRHRAVGRVREGATITLTGVMSSGFAQTRFAGRARWVSLQYLAAVPRSTPSGRRGERVLAYARKQLGKPYQWGAEGPRRYDCSGLTMMAWRAAGVSIPRTTRTQYRLAGARVPRSELRPGDLVFFYRSPSHVALYVGGGVILHAPRPGTVVRYARLDSMPYKGAVRPG